MTDRSEEATRIKVLLAWARAAMNGHAALHRVTIDEALELAGGQNRALPAGPSMTLAFLEDERRTHEKEEDEARRTGSPAQP